MGGVDKDDDHFGLPDPDFKPLEDLETQEKTAPITEPEKPHWISTDEPDAIQEEIVSDRDETSSRSEQPPVLFSSQDRLAREEKRTKRNVVLAILIPAILLIASFFIYQYWVGISMEKQRAAEAAKKAQEEQRLRDELARKAKEVPVIQTPAIPVPGTIQILEGPTSRYYVIVHSSIDADLLMDQAKKFSAEGISVVVIPPFGKWKFNRLAITSEGNFTLAQQQADQLKEKYGQDLWVLRY